MRAVLGHMGLQPRLGRYAAQGAYNPTSMALLQGLSPGVPRLAAKNKDVPQGQRVPTHVLFDMHASLPPDVFDLDVGDLAGNLTSTFASREGPEKAPVSTHLEVTLESHYKFGKKTELLRSF